MTSLTVEKLGPNFDAVSRRGLLLVYVEGKINGPRQLGGGMGAVKDVVRYIRPFGPHGGCFARCAVHVAVLADYSFFSVRSGLPFPVGLLDPGPVRAGFVVTGSAKFGRFNKIRLFYFVPHRPGISPWPHLGLTGLNDVTEIKGLFFGGTGNVMTDFAGDPFVRPGSSGGLFGRDITGQKSKGRMTTDTARFYAGHLGFL